MKKFLIILLILVSLTLFAKKHKCLKKMRKDLVKAAKIQDDLKRLSAYDRILMKYNLKMKSKVNFQDANSVCKAFFRAVENKNLKKAGKYILVKDRSSFSKAFKKAMKANFFPEVIHAKAFLVNKKGKRSYCKIINSIKQIEVDMVKVNGKWYLRR